MKFFLSCISFLVFLLFPASSFALSQETAPLLPERVSEQFVRDVRVSVRAGRNYTFAKVGDSNTEMPQNIYAIGCSSLRLGPYKSLRKTVLRYKKTAIRGTNHCNKANSFSHVSATSRSASSSALYLQSLESAPESGWFWKEPLCLGSESYFSCEMRLSRPRYTIISTGTNDRAWKISYTDSKRNIKNLVLQARQAKSAPVLTTLPPIVSVDNEKNIEYVRNLNQVVIDVAQETGAPLINNWRLLHSLPNSGLGDGLHLSFTGDPLFTTAIFTSEHFSLGANRRNLLFLQALKRLDCLLARFKGTRPKT